MWQVKASGREPALHAAVNLVAWSVQSSQCAAQVEQTPASEAAIPLELALIVLPCVKRPRVTPCASTLRLFSSRITSAASLLMSLPESTEMPAVLVEVWFGSSELFILRG